MPIGKLSKIPGLGADPSRVLIEAFNGLVSEVNRIASTPRTTALLRGGHLASEGETVRMRGGERLTLPRARAENTGAQIRVILETEGTLTVVCNQGQVNAVDTYSVGFVGLYIFQSNGTSGWFSADGGASGAMFIPGRSVLGKPDAGSGPAEAITVSTLGHVLRYDGTVIHWDYPLTVERNNVGIGEAYIIDFRDALDSTTTASVSVAGGDAIIRYAVNLAGTFAWTGVHSFDNAIKAINDQLVTTTGTITDLALSADTNRLRMGGGSGDRLLVSMDPGSSPDGRVVFILNIDGTATDDLVVQHDDGATGTAAMRFLCADAKNARIGSRGMGIAVYDDTSARWYLSVVSAEATNILEIRYNQAADASISETPPSGCTWFEVEAVGGGGGGGGADADSVKESAAGSGGGAGAWFRQRIAVASGAITGAIGAAGTAGANTGGNGGNGGDTTVTYNGVTYTAAGGGGGDGTSVGPNADSQFNASQGSTGGAPDATATERAGGGDGNFGAMFSVSANANSAVGGTGGASKFGGGGRGGRINTDGGSSAGTAANAPGAGGGGGARTSTGAASTGAVGGAGAPGAMKITFYSGTMPTEATIN